MLLLLLLLLLLLSLGFDLCTCLHRVGPIVDLDHHQPEPTRTNHQSTSYTAATHSLNSPTHHALVQTKSQATITSPLATQELVGNPASRLSGGRKTPHRRQNLQMRGASTTPTPTRHDSPSLSLSLQIHVHILSLDLCETTRLQPVFFPHQVPSHVGQSRLSPLAFAFAVPVVLGHLLDARRAR
ncbi:hypothetical protein BD289DRAFT_437562 [Coniella lustricola]|uniref:Secreted protein n=1 Tax=Coniella lustricola TaxID=2025994 RepID=A0A2T3A3U9_9PEZI|nr:hypothetical protein BD289DRAFT_437562 [Coniella lustricola]